LKLAEHLGCPTQDRRMMLRTTAADDALLTQLWEALSWQRGRPTVVINSSGAFGAAKLWPVDHVEALARRLVADRPWQVLLHCGPAERAAADAVAARIRHPLVKSMGVSETLPIGLTKAVLAEAAAVVSTDSGPRHIAVAFDREVISLHGPTAPGWTTTYNVPERCLSRDLPCQPCYKRSCPLGHHRCMKDLGVDQVYWHVVSAVEGHQRRHRSAA
jgi:heptosyltransferase II